MFFAIELIAVILQVATFIPFYLVWRKDCKEIGKDNLAVSLSERFVRILYMFRFGLSLYYSQLKG